MLDFATAPLLVEQFPSKYKEAVRCCIDMELSNPSEGYWVIHPGEFVSKGKADEDFGFDDWFEPSIIGTVYGDPPKEWLLVGVYKIGDASGADLDIALGYIFDRNLGILQELGGSL